VSPPRPIDRGHCEYSVYGLVPVCPHCPRLKRLGQESDSRWLPSFSKFSSSSAGYTSPCRQLPSARSAPQFRHTRSPHGPSSSACFCRLGSSNIRRGSLVHGRMGPAFLTACSPASGMAFLGFRGRPTRSPYERGSLSFSGGMVSTVKPRKERLTFCDQTKPGANHRASHDDSVEAGLALEDRKRWITRLPRTTPRL
jgi:hypothetical protein